MDNLTLLEVSKPDKIKEALNQLINYMNTLGGIPNITAESLGLGNVDNTRDADKPVSTNQKTYIDNENSKDFKLKSDKVQKIESDILIAEDKSLYFERGNNSYEETASITNEGGYETFNVGSNNIPLKLRHSTKDINETIVSKNPKIDIVDENGVKTQEYLALVSDIKSELAKLVGSAPETLDTLEEIANVLASNSDVTAALYEAIGSKASQTDLDSTNSKVDENTAEIESINASLGDIETILDYINGEVI